MSATKLNYRSRNLGPAHIRFYGKMGPLGDEQKEAFHLARNLRIKSFCSILPPDQEHAEARHKVTEHQPGEILYGEAVVLDREGQGAVFTSSDYPITVIADERSGRVGVAHTGPESLLKPTPDCPSCGSGVLENLFAAMGNPYGENLLVFVTGGISARNFPHSQEEVRPFIDKFGLDVVPDPQRHTLDLFRVIRRICVRRGIKKERIFSDGLCTFETPWTASSQAKKDGSNWTYVGKCR